MFNFLKKLSTKEAGQIEKGLAAIGLKFDDLKSAEEFFFAERDKDLKAIASLNNLYPELDLNFKAKSLQRFESFYFKVFVDKKVTIDITKKRMEELLTQYMRQVFVSNEMAEWKVFENDFAEGHYVLGIMYGYGSMSMEDYANDLDKKKDNKRRAYLFNKFMMYVPEELENDIL
jgi:hypothetical protein